MGIVLPAKAAREEGFAVGEIVSVIKDAGRFIIEKKAPTSKKSAGNAKLINWAEEAVERYRPALEALKDA